VLNFLASFMIIIVFLNSCGVNTSSSPSEQGNTDVPTDSNTNDGSGDLALVDPNPVYSDSDTDTGLDLIDPNPVYDGDGVIVDENSTDGTPSGGDVVADQNKSTFDVSGAVLDEHACIVGNRNNGYTDISMKDSSADDRPNVDLSYGVMIDSELSLVREDSDSTIVTVFYNALTVQRDEKWQNIREQSLGYQLSVDTAWTRNDNNTMYVMTPKNAEGYYGCYRYYFSSPSEGTFTSTRTKVYRNNI
jgi:hypothetical protein